MDEKKAQRDENTEILPNNSDKSAEQPFVRETDKEDFDIGDFILKHSIKNTTLKKSRVPRIIIACAVALLIITICIIAAFLTAPSKSIIGKWKSEDGVVMEIIDEYVIINNSSMKYVIEEDNILSLRTNGEYVKIIYEVSGDSLIFTIAVGEKVETVQYTRC